jgi:hypothetical protein
MQFEFMNVILLYSDQRRVSGTHVTIFSVVSARIQICLACFLLGNSQAFEFYIPTFRNSLCSIFIYEDGTDRVFRNIGI